MKTIRRIAELRRAIRRARRAGKTIGFVPTMGALHDGHLSLIRAARRQTQVVVVSIFVNPIQFNQKSDFRRYPRTLRQDAALTRQAGADLLFVPSAGEIYPRGFQTFVEVTHLSRRWEGVARPGHFRGVTTVVAKLFHLVEPTIAYFGQKDAQQARIIQQIARDLDFDLRVKVLPTVREAGGLAMSSRNERLSLSQRWRAAAIHNALQEGRRLLKWGSRRTEPVLRRMKQVLRRTPGVRLEYLAVVDPDSLEPVSTVRGPALIVIAARVGAVRLIDCCRVQGE